MSPFPKPRRLRSSRRLAWTTLVTLAAVSVFAAEPVPDFRLTDLSPRSNRSAQPVSPRDYLYQVAGFYFATAG